VGKVSTIATMGEYIAVSGDMWDDFSSVAQSRGLAFDYSVEDSADGRIEYHIHSHVEEAESIIWAILVLRGFESMQSGASVAEMPMPHNVCYAEQSEK
jgi:hypothetical protein